MTQNTGLSRRLEKMYIHEKKNVQCSEILGFVAKMCAANKKKKKIGRNRNFLNKRS